MAALRRFTKTLGTLLTIAAIVFVVIAFLQSGAAQSELWASPRAWLVVVAISVLYSASLGLIVGCWILLLTSSSAVPVERNAALRVYAVFQLLKYAPTNLVHHAGRYALLRQIGIDHAAIAWSSVVEAALISASALVVSAVFGLEFLRTGLTKLPAWSLFAIAGVMTLFAAVLLVSLRRSAVMRRSFARITSPKSLRAVALTVPLYMLFFIAAGAEFWLMAQWLPGDLGHPGLGASIAALSAAWLLGFLTPGAPAGVGIREAMIMLSLGVGENAISGAVLLSAFYRVATIIGDLVFAGACYLLSVWLKGRGAAK